MSARCAVIAGVLLVSGCGLLDARDDTALVVRADVFSADLADAACGDLPGIDQEEKSWSSTSDQPPGVMAEGVFWTVRGRANANEVASCLQDFGAAEIAVEDATAPKSFEPTGP